MKKKLIPLFLTIFSFLVLVFTIYKSEIVWAGTKTGYYSIYYFISFFLLLISIISFYLNEIYIRYFSIFLISFLVSIYSFEIYLKFYISKQEEKIAKLEFKNKKIIYQNKTGKEYDSRKETDVFNKLSSKYQSTAVPVTGSELKNFIHQDLFPLAGISNSVTLHCNELGYYSIYKSDRFGFNNPNFEWDSKEIEYILLGDSFVHGACVNRPDDIASQLRILSNKNVLNLGYQGNAAMSQYATLKEYFKKSTNKILWFYFEGNDLAGLKEETKNTRLLKYLNDDSHIQNLKFKQDIIDLAAKKAINKSINDIKKIEKKSEKKISIKNLLILSDTRKIILAKYLPINFQNIIEVPSEFKKILLLTIEFAKRNNSELYFIYLPEYKRYISKYNNKNYLKIKNTIRNLNIRFIDIHKDVFMKSKNPLEFFPFNKNGHYNEKGYKLIANEIYKVTK